MAELKCKTNKNSSPQGKPRVYFTCHPDDFNNCFGTICEEIFKYQNCAVYYYSPGKDSADDSRTQQLGDMQLFVMPVTSNLLFKPNYALSLDFKYARENHIRILPIMHEKDLEDVFNRKCGSLQFLDKLDNDPTSLSYEEKLRKFLETVLISEEMSQKIRDAFNAYIFLSYRKKDRNYARKLMELIHKNEYFRDVAIWYDEYLTPGEDFNDEIVKSLKKSVLFMLLVTPNILETPNYVMEDEYPTALKYSKEIVAAEAIATNRSELEEKFESIPECIDAYDEDSVFEKLMGLVVKNTDRNNSPEHIFFIGLAYLAGIDVEINHKCGMELITCSAEQELPEAIEKLVNIYIEGDGTEQNLTAALHWQKKLVEVFEKKLAKANTAENGTSLFKERRNLANLYHTLSEFGKASEVCEFTYGEFSDKEYIEKSDLAELLDLWGVVCHELCDYEKSRSLLMKSIAIYDGLVKSDYEKYAYCIAGTYINMAGICGQMLRISEAEELYLRGIKIFEERCSSGFNEFLPNLFLSYSNLGYLYYTANNIKKAEQMYERGLEKYNLLCDDDADANRNTLAGLYTNMGLMYKSINEFSKAEDIYLSALKIREALYADNPELYRWYLANCYCNLSVLYEDSDLPDKAEMMIRKAIELLEAVYNTNPESVIDDLGKYYNNLGFILYVKKQFSEALKFQLKSIELYDIIKGNNTGIILTDYALSCHNAGRIYFALKKYREAKEMFLKAKDIREEINSQNVALQGIELCASYNDLGGLYMVENNMDEAEKCFKNSVKLSGELRKLDAQLYEKEHVSSLLSIAEFYTEKKDFELSEQYYIEAKEICRNNYKTKPEAFGALLVIACIGMGHIYYMTEQFKSASTVYEEAVDTTLEIYKNNPEKRDLYLADAGVYLAAVYLKQGEYNKAETALLKSIKIRERQYSDEPEKYREELAYAYDCMARVYGSTRQDKKARNMKSRSDRLLKKK